MNTVKLSEEELNAMDKKLLVQLVLQLQSSLESLSGNMDLLLEQIRGE